MSFFKNLSEKAMSTAQAIGTKSQEMVEIGKLKLQISQIDGEIKKLKFEIGELIYDAYSKSQEAPDDLIVKINADITAKFAEIEELKVKIQEVQAKEGSDAPAETEEAVEQTEEQPVEEQDTPKDDPNQF